MSKPKEKDILGKSKKAKDDAKTKQLVDSILNKCKTNNWSAVCSHYLR